MRFTHAAFIGVVSLAIGTRALAGPITASPAVFNDHAEAVQGTCANYRSELMTGVVDSTGGTHAGHCRYSELTPLFDGKSLTDYWTAVTQGTTHPLHVVPAPPQSGSLGVCAKATIVALTLSARVEVSRFEWQNGPSGGPGVQAMCTTEWQRVNPASTINASLLQSRANALISHVILALAPAPAFTACTTSRIHGALQRAVEVKFKAALQAIADREQHGWRLVELSQDDPGVGADNRCMPQCGVCTPTGWVGTIACKKTVSGPYGYNHDETQTWFVGGTTSQNPAGQTVYPTAWTATGNGGKTGQSWHVNATGAGTLAVFPAAGVTNFLRTNAQLSVFFGIQGTPTSYTEYEHQFAPFSSTDPHNANGSRTDTGQSCETPVTPGGSTCTVVCSWGLISP